jgi:ATP-binding cassette subfamily C protein CydD
MGAQAKDALSDSPEPEAAAKKTAAERLMKQLSRPVAGWTGAASAFAVARGFAAIAFAWGVAGALDLLLRPGAGGPALSSWLAGLAALAVARSLFLFLSQRAAGRASVAARRALFDSLLAKIGALGPEALGGRSTGDLVTRLTDGVAALDPYWRRYAPASALASAQPLAALAVIAPLDWISASILVASLPVLMLAMILAGLKAKAASERQWRTLARLGGQLLDAIQGLDDIVLFNAAKREAAHVRAVADAYRRETMGVLRLAFLSSLALEFCATAAIAALAIAIGYRLMAGQMDFRIGLFVLIAAPEVYGPIRALGSERHARMDSLAAAEGLAEILALPEPPSGRAKLAAGPATIRFEHVSFAYPDGGYALSDLCFEIRGGERVALVGPSGAGKSTLLALLLGFLAPTAGRITIDGVDLAELDRADWRQRIAYLPQRAHMFDADVEANVALGRSARGRDPVGAALVEAGLADAVAALPQGRRTRLAENGKGLSGGEIQRLGMARAFYGGGALVVVDEPTAHLDAATERALVERIGAFARGRTLLMAAHRPASLAIADRVLTLERGRLVADVGAAAEVV